MWNFLYFILGRGEIVKSYLTSGTWKHQQVYKWVLFQNDVEQLSSGIAVEQMWNAVLGIGRDTMPHTSVYSLRL